MLLYNKCTNAFCDVNNINDGNVRYCYKCGSQTTFLYNGILNDWEPSKEALLSLLQLEEDICGVGNVAKSIDPMDWSYFNYNILTKKSTYLSDLLEGSYAKQCNNKLMIYVQTIDAKNYLDNPQNQQLLINAAIETLSDEIDELHILAYQEHLPAPKPVDDFEIPF